MTLLDLNKKGAMPMFERWKSNKETTALYDAEEKKLQLLLAQLQGGTDEYEKVQNQLKATSLMRKDSRESKGMMNGNEKASIWRKILGGGITIGGVLLLGHYEAEGNMFTGEKKKFADGLTSVLCKMFKGGD